MKNKVMSDLLNVIRPMVNTREEAEKIADRVYTFLNKRNSDNINVMIGQMMKFNPVEFDNLLDVHPLSYYFNRILRTAMLTDDGYVNVLRKTVEKIKENDLYLNQRSKQNHYE